MVISRLFIAPPCGDFRLHRRASVSCAERCRGPLSAELRPPKAAHRWISPRLDEGPQPRRRDTGDDKGTSARPLGRVERWQGQMLLGTHIHSALLQHFGGIAMIKLGKREWDVLLRLSDFAPSDASECISGGWMEWRTVYGLRKEQVSRCLRSLAEKGLAERCGSEPSSRDKSSAPKYRVSRNGEQYIENVANRGNGEASA